MRFQWLKDYQETEQQILYLRWNLNKTKLELARWSGGDLAKYRLEKGSHGAQLERIIERDQKELEELRLKQVEVEQIVNSFKGLDNQILVGKYIKGLTLEQVAVELNYSVSYVQKCHANLRRSITFLDEYFIEQSNLKRKIYEQELAKKR